MTKNTDLLFFVLSYHIITVISLYTNKNQTHNSLIVLFFSLFLQIILFILNLIESPFSQLTSKKYEFRSFFLSHTLLIYFSFKTGEMTWQKSFLMHMMQELTNISFKISLSQSLHIFIFSSIFTFFLTLLFPYPKNSFNVLMQIIFYSLFNIIRYLLFKFNRALRGEFSLYKEKINQYNDNLFSLPNFPMFIISKEMVIQYKNSAAENFCRNILGNSKSIPSNFIDLTDNESSFTAFFSQIFFSKEKYTSFYYPFTQKNDNYNKRTERIESDENPLLISNDIVQLKWFEIMVSPCIYKGVLNYFLLLLPYNSMPIYDLFEKYFRMSVQNLYEIISDFDTVANEIQNVNKIFEDNKKQFVLKMRAKIANAFSIGNTSMRLYPKNLNPVTQKFSFFQNKVASYASAYFDFGIWFHFSNKCNVLRNLFGTLELYARYYLNTYIYKYEIFKLQEFISIFSDFLFIPAQLLNFTIDFTIKEEVNNVTLNLFYFENVLFNILLFLIYNTKNKNEKKRIKVTFENKTIEEMLKNRVKNILTSIENNMYIKVTISCMNSEQIINFDDINQKIAYRMNNNEPKESIADGVPIGILIANLVVKVEYKNEISSNCKERHQLITYYAIGTKPSAENVKKKAYKIKSFYNKTNYDGNKKYYEKIFEYLYKKKIDLDDYQIYKTPKRNINIPHLILGNTDDFFKKRTSSYNEQRRKYSTFKPKTEKLIKRCTSEILNDIKVPIKNKQPHRASSSIFLSGKPWLSNEFNIKSSNFHDEKLQNSLGRKIGSIYNKSHASSRYVLKKENEKEKEKDNIAEEPENEKDKDNDSEDDEDEEIKEDNLDVDYTILKKYKKLIEQVKHPNVCCFAEDNDDIKIKKNFIAEGNRRNYLTMVLFKEMEVEYNNKILFFQDPAYSEGMSKAFLIIIEYVDKENIPFKVDYGKGDYKEFKKLITMKRNKREVFNLIFIETSNKDKYEKMLVKDDNSIKSKVIIIVNQIDQIENTNRNYSIITRGDFKKNIITILNSINKI